MFLSIHRFEQNSSDGAIFTSTPQKPADANLSIGFRLNAPKFFSQSNEKDQDQLDDEYFIRPQPISFDRHGILRKTVVYQQS